MTRPTIQHWLDFGQGPALVFVHGWAASGEFFAAQQALAKQGFRVIIPDLPGHGPSAVPTPGLTIADLGAALADFLHARALVNPVVVGWSMGLLVALEALTRRSIGAAGLAILDMTPKVANAPDWAYGIASRQTTADMMATADAMAADWADFAPRIACSLFARGKAPEAAFLAEATARITAQDGPTLAALWRSLAHCDMRAALQTCGLPLRVILGAQSRIYAPKLAEFYRETYPQARLTVLDGAGHAPQIEQPEAVNAALAEFAAEVSIKHPDPSLP